MSIPTITLQQGGEKQRTFEEAEKMKNITPSFISDEKRQIWQMKQI